MSRRKKTVYACVLGLCGMALLIDRLLGLTSSGPAAASATAGSSLSSLGVELGGGPGVVVVAAPFPADLPATRDVDGMRDVFGMSRTVRRALSGGVDGTSPDEYGANGSGPGSAQGATFADRFPLKAVFLFDGESIAVAGDRWLRIGDVLEGHKLVAIAGTQATFEGPSGPVTLSVIDSR